MPLSRNKICQQAPYPSTFAKGLDYFHDGKVNDVVIVDEVSPYKRYKATVHGRSMYSVFVSLDENLDIADYQCNCEAFYNYEGACKHIVATLMSLLTYIEQNPEMKPNDNSQNNIFQKRSDNIVFSLINKCINDDIAKTEVGYKNNESLVKLVPILNCEHRDAISLSFTIGNVRQYVVKNINELCINIRNGSTVSYGKQLTFNHSLYNFDEQSQKLAKLLMNKSYERMIEFRNSYYQYDDFKRDMYLKPVVIDQLFDILNGTELKVITSNNEGMLLCVDETPKVHLKITKVDGGISASCHGITAIGGEKHCYILTDTKMCRCDDSYKSFYDDFLNPIMKNNNKIFIAQKDMNDFFNILVPAISEYITISGSTDYLEAFAPDKCEPELYLDAVEKNLITGLLYFNYGQTKINSFDKTTYDEIKRDNHKELKSKRMVGRYFNNVDNTTKGYYLTAEDDGIYSFITETLPVLTENFNIFATDRFKNIGITPPTKTTVGVSVVSNLLEIDISNVGFDLSELDGILKGYRQNKKYHRLKNGSFLSLDDSSISSIAQLTDSLDISKKQMENGKIIVPKHRAIFLDSLLHGDEAIKFERDSYFKELIRTMKSIEDSDWKVPQSLDNILRNYQQTGFRWLKTLEQYGFSGILADDMGLGKSLEIISVLLSEKENGNKIPSLIVCPTTLVLNWVDEFIKFAPSMNVLAINGNLQKRIEDMAIIPNFDVVIISYDHLKRDVELYNNIEFYYHIIDEAQVIKNQNTLVARSVKTISSKYRCALTGTPIENRISELWSIFDFLMPLYLHNYTKFKQKFEIPAVKDNNQIILERLNKMIAPFVLRRMKKDVLKELPDKTEMIFYTEMEEEQQKIYLANVVKAKEQINATDYNTNKIAIFAMLTRLRQLCCDPKLCYENYNGGSGKLEACIGLILEAVASGHKILLFSQFTSMLNILEERLLEEEISYYKLQGSTKKNERHELVEKFNNDDTNVFLISLKAGGTGLNLTAADVVIHYDPWWNLAAQNQATDRAYRIGQRNNVIVYKLIAKGTIEENIVKLQQTKMNLVDSVIQEGDGILSSITRDELFELF